MFAREVEVTYRDGHGVAKPCPLAWTDNFAMRNFTNDAVFDDTLPLRDGCMEIGNRVPLDRLQSAMDDWFRRKGYIKAGDSLAVKETPRAESARGV